MIPSMFTSKGVTQSELGKGVSSLDASEMFCILTIQTVILMFWFSLTLPTIFVSWTHFFLESVDVTPKNDWLDLINKSDWTALTFEQICWTFKEDLQDCQCYFERIVFPPDPTQHMISTLAHRSLITNLFKASQKLTLDFCEPS